MLKIEKYGNNHCSACKQAEVAMRKFSHDIEYVDTDANMDRARNANVISLPTYIVYRGTEEVGRICGYTPNIMGRILDLVEQV